METEIVRVKKTLLSKGLSAPLPITMIPVSLTENEPARMTRKEIASKFPNEFSISPIEVIENQLVSALSEKLFFQCDKSFKNLKPILPGYLHYGEISSKDNFSINDLCNETDSFRPIKNYSLAVYRISTSNKDNWTHNFFWEKIREVKKAKVV